MRGKVKRKKQKPKTQTKAKTDFEFVGLHKARCRQSSIKRRERKNLIPANEDTTVIVFALAFDLQSTLASHLGGGVIMGFLCQHV